MNKKLIFQLSLFGLAMAFATVSLIPSTIEPIVWLAIFLFCAYVIAKKCKDNYFLTGLWVSLLNAVWITAVHILLYKTYILNHPQEAAMVTKMPMPNLPELMMLITGPIIGLVTGLILGMFAFAASKIIQKD